MTFRSIRNGANAARHAPGARFPISPLPAATQTTVQRDYSRRWRAAREANLARQNAPTTAPALVRKETARCVVAFQFGLQALDSDPRGYSDIDVNAPGGDTRLERFRSPFDDTLEWWRERAAQLASRQGAAAPRLDQRLTTR